MPKSPAQIPHIPATFLQTPAARASSLVWRWFSKLFAGRYYSRIQRVETIPYCKRHPSSSSLFPATALCFIVVAGIGVIIAGAPHRIKEELTQQQPFSQDTAMTCAAITPLCGCEAKTVFHNGTTAYIQFKSARQQVISETIRYPHGNSFDLSFYKTGKSSPRKDEGCFIAKFPVSRHTESGNYSVSLTISDNADQQERVLLQNFIVRH